MIKILYIGVHYQKNEKLWRSETWINNAFKKNNVQTFLIDYREVLKDKSEQFLKEKIKLDSENCDLIFLQRGDGLTPDLFENIKTPKIFWSTEPIQLKNDVDKLLDECSIAIFMSTGAAYNAALNGNIVLNLRSELNLMDNYLDIFDKDFKFTNSYSLNSIENVLREFINNETKVQEYTLEFERLRKYLTNGMNLINDLNLSKFKPS